MYLSDENRFKQELLWLCVDCGASIVASHDMQRFNTLEECSCLICNGGFLCFALNEEMNWDLEWQEMEPCNDIDDLIDLNFVMPRWYLVWNN